MTSADLGHVAAQTQSRAKPGRMLGFATTESTGRYTHLLPLQLLVQ